MIISRTPYRVSFAGGGSDLPAYCDHEPGMVLSTTIDRHVYVQISRRFAPDWRIRAGAGDLSTTDVCLIDHPIIRECLKLHAVKEPLEIVITGDLPGGTGLGSSSSLTVGLLAALDAWRGRRVNAKALAQQACMVEMGLLRKPIGYQDAYAAAFGGFNAISFKKMANVWVEPIKTLPKFLEVLQSRVLMFYLGGQRSADEILARQTSKVLDDRDITRRLVENAQLMLDFITRGSVADMGRLLGQAWGIKRALGCGISNNGIDQAVNLAHFAGAWGSKLLGAGGGGFLLTIAPPERHDAIRESLGRPRELPFRMSTVGTEVIYDDGVR